jgi:hypothetical protein
MITMTATLKIYNIQGFSSLRMPTQDDINSENILDKVYHIAVKEILLRYI